MDFYLPSDIARVVLSYLKENSYTKTYNCFMEECSLLQEYCMLVKTGRTPRITHLPQLGSILDEWGKLKQSERVFEKQDLSIQCSLAQEHHLLINDVTKLTSVSPLKSISNQPERQTFSKCRAPSGERSDKTTPHNGNIRATPQSKKVLFSPIPKSASDLKTWNDDCDSTAESLTTNSCLKSHHVVCPSSTLELNGNVDTDNDHCASSRTAENFAIVRTPSIVSALDRSEVSLANHEEGSHDEGSLDKKSSSHNAPCTLADNTSTSIVAPDVTPKKAELPLDKAWVTPVKLLLQNEANKSPRRKKPKTPRKRVSDGHTRSAEAAADRQVDTQPFFQQILSDTRLHEKIAETCNSLVSGGLKHSSRHGDKSAIKESANLRKLSAEEQETLFACKSLEEVLETGSDLDMLEKFDMSDPVYETLFKMFGTDRTTFLEGLRKEKSESEIQAENEELERSIHEIYEECASMAANSPHLVASQQELLGATAPFTPLLRVHKLVSKAPHTSASEGSSPVYHPESPFRHSNPATPIQHDPCQSYSDSVQLSSPNSHHHLHSTPHGPSAVKKHANHKICSENILSNCSPLVKGDLCPGSPIMMQTNAPRTRKNIVFSSDNSGSYFSSIAASQAQTSVEQSQPCFAALAATGPSQSGVAQQEMHTGFLQFLGETVEQMDLGSSTLPGTLVAQPPCSTIENSIDCISLPKPNTTTVGARAHGQGMGKKGGRRKQSTKKSKKGQVKSETQSFSTLKGLLEKPQLSRNVFPLSLTPKKNEPSAFTNQNITIVSPGVPELTFRCWNVLMQ
ncbi:uncharacterized protein LOC127852831 isoform X3 [Dreissena polymorpha]|uniref:uncharacterized protein LOC127852831 isoform X3 n=1 Tax=Dreissena polymorpha TaxID=45954 RepID=UPI002264FBB4|nr:uncharacterized protein LOC127852831 isoform X3 [Dreissena polymorpha]